MRCGGVAPPLLDVAGRDPMNDVRCPANIPCELSQQMECAEEFARCDLTANTTTGAAVVKRIIQEKMKPGKLAAPVLRWAKGYAQLMRC